MESKDIKKLLKEKGFDTKKISVKHRYCGYSESFDITIKDINININEIENIIKSLEYYERDERTGEILEGGNTYIFTQYDFDTIKEANEKYNQKIIDIIEKELSTRTIEEKTSWNNGDCNPVISLTDKIICYRYGSAIEIRDLETYTTFRSGLTYLAETLIKMGVLNKVLGE